MKTNQHNETCCSHNHSHQEHHSHEHTHCPCSQCTGEKTVAGSTDTTTTASSTNCTHECTCHKEDGDGESSEDDQSSHCHHSHHHSHEDDGCGCGHDHHDHEEDGCGCGHDHGKKADASTILSLIGGTALFVTGMFTQTSYPTISVVLFLVSYLIIGGKVLLHAGKNILRGKIFDENFLMAIATIGAFAIGEYAEGIAVMLFYQVGELFQSYAVRRSKNSITALMNIRPDYANLLQSDGNSTMVNPQDIAIGDIILIKPGEKIPLDCVVTSGQGSIDTSSITGESLPRSIHVGDELLSGCINRDGVIKAEVTKLFKDSTVNKILEMTQNAANKKAVVEKYITKFAKIYTPMVVLVAMIVAFIVPLLLGEEISKWVYRALVFLVISCPCALVISIPLGFFGGIGGASKCGILIKGGNDLERLARVDTVVFDKTGTLTKGIFQVVARSPQGIPQEELLAYTAMAESYSTHPIATSVVTAYEKESGEKLDRKNVLSYTEYSGYGVSAMVDGKLVLAGNKKLMEKENIHVPAYTAQGTEILVAIDGIYVGRLTIADTLKEDVPQAIQNLKKHGVKNVVMLTGDAHSTAEIIAKEAGVDTFYAQLLPGDKVTHVESLLAKQQPKGCLVFVGDGINDAPVLTRADIGVAMGGIGSDAAIESADVVLMTDQPARLVTGIQVAKKTMSIIHQNIALALGIKFIVMTLGVFGIASMWLAVFADVGVSILAILNSVRALNVKKFLD